MHLQLEVKISLTMLVCTDVLTLDVPVFNVQYGIKNDILT